jgi:hypothetical protein
MRRALAPLALLAALAGCGDDGGGELTKAEFIKQADAICTKFDARLKAIPQPKTAAEIADYADKATPVAREGVDDLRELEAPDDFAAQAKTLIDGLDSDVKLFEDLASAAAKNDTARLEEIGGEAERRTAERERQARSAGFKSCGIEDPS